MDWPENLLILLGISLDIFAGMECKGSLVAKIEKKQLVLACAVVSVWQAAALFAGNLLSTFLLRKDGIAENEIFIGSAIAVAIFICLGARLLLKAIKNESIYERREAGIRVTNYIPMVKVAGFYTLLTGIAFGFVGTKLLDTVIMMVLFSVLVVIAGLYTGYHFGFQQKSKAYIAGAVLLWLAGGDLVARNILEMF
ncbi:MAG: manganese efflux pump [Roseburia sp.]|nr:manganese efflux pump [Roseburia sp.]